MRRKNRGERRQPLPLSSFFPLCVSRSPTSSSSSSYRAIDFVLASSGARENWRESIFFFSFRSRTKRRFQRRSRISIIIREALSSSLSSRALLPFIPRVSRGEKEKERAFHEHHPAGIFRTRLLRQQILLSARILYTEGIESKRIVYLEI